jgi:hypothetical protein
MNTEMTPAEIRTANAIIGFAMEKLAVTDEDRADEIMGQMLEVYEPGMTVDDLLAQI